MEQYDCGLDDDPQQHHELLRRDEGLKNSDGQGSEMTVRENPPPTAPTLAQTDIDQAVVATSNVAADAAEMGTQIRETSFLANIEPAKPDSGCCTGTASAVQAMEDGAAVSAIDATEPVDLAGAESPDVSLPEADTPGTIILEANTATKDTMGYQNVAQPDTSEPSAQKHKRPRRGGGRVRPSQRTWEETQFDDLESLIGVFKEYDNDYDNASCTNSSLSGNSSDRILDEDREWTDILLEDDDSNALIDGSPSQREWLRQKQEGCEQHEHLDRIMSMVGHEQVKAHFLDVKARVEAAKRWGGDLRSLKLDLILHGSDGTGKRRIAQLYAEFLYSIGAVPRRSFKRITGYSLLQEDDSSTVIFFQDADQIDCLHEIEDIMKAVQEKQDGAVLVFSYRELSESSKNALKATAESQARFPDPMRLRDYNEDEMTQLLRRLLTTQSLEFEKDQGETGIRALVRRALQNQKRGGHEPGNIHSLKLELDHVCVRRTKRLEKEWDEWAKTHSPTQNRDLDMQNARYGPITREDVFGPEPRDLRSESDAWKEIQNMVGLEGVKKEIDRLFTLAKVNYWRETRGEQPMNISLNRVFLGDPGVGKTTVAMLYGQIVAKLGFVSNGQVITKNPGDLICGYIGQSETKTRKVLKEAKGNILIIDDAHMLHPPSEQDFRHGIIDTLVANITGLPGENRCIILCGYVDVMENMFLKTNPGLQRRFPLEDAIKFSSYNDTQLSGILEQKMSRDELLASEHARKVAHEVLSRMRIRPGFGNGGDVENLLARAKLRQRDRLEAAGIDRLDMHRHPLEASDFDPDHDRSLSADKDRDELFEEFVGFETIIAQFSGYQKMTDGMRRHGIDPRPYVPWAFVFKGPPGTGKTSTARKVGKLFYNMGFISSDEVIICSATDLIGRYIGHTGPKVISQFEQGLGKVLFIDEAYRLDPGSGGGGSFIREAIGEIVDIMTKPRFAGNMVVILAGYEKDMEGLMQSNPGLRGRFPTHITFPNMTPEHCLQHLKRQLRNLKIEISGDIEDRTDERWQLILQSFKQLSQTKGWANGRDIETLAKSIIQSVFVKAAEAEAERESTSGKLAVNPEGIFSKLEDILKERGSSAKPPDLDMAIEIARQGVKATPEDHPNRAGRMNNLAVILGDRYSRTGAIADLEEAIEIGRQSVEATPEDHPDRAGRMNILGISLGERYKRTGAIADLEEAIEIVRQSVEATPEDHPNRAMYSNSLGGWLRERYLRTGAMVDLEEAIETAGQAVKATPEDHPNRAMYLNNLGLSLRDRYSRTGAIADLEEAIEIGRQAVEATLEDHLNRAMYLSNLGISLGDRYTRTGAMADLEEAIEIGRQAVEATPEDHPNRAGMLNNLKLSLRDRYSRTGAIADLEEAIEIGRQAVEVTPEDHPNRAMYLNNLGISLGGRYKRTGAMADLEEAIEIGRQAVKATPEDHPNHAIYSNSLGGWLMDRYSRTGVMADLEEAIEIGRQSVEATPEDHPNRAGRMNSLAVILGDRYERTGAIADLEEAIEIGRQSVKATPEDHPDRAMYSNSLGGWLRERYLRTGAMADLEEAIEIGRQAVEVTPEDHPNRAMHLSNLGISLVDGYTRTGAMADLEEAIEIARQAVEATPQDHSNRAGRMNSLAVILGDRYERTGAMADIEEAIEIARQAVKATPEDHPNRAMYSNNLGSRLRSRYTKTGAMADLKEAIGVSRQAVEATSEDHPNRAIYLNNLGIRLWDRYSRTGAIEDGEESTRLFLTALNLRMSLISNRISPGRNLLSSPIIFQNTQQAFEVAETVVSLVRQLAPQSLQNTDKEHLLSQAAGIGSDAAAVMLQAGKGPFAAIEMLETSCGVLMGSLYDLRTNVSALEQSYPELSKTFISLRDTLDAPVSRNISQATVEDPIRIAQREGDQRREAADQLEIVIQKIRELPGFERFLLPPSEDEVCQAASNGPIVVLNASPHRCDALIVETSGIRTLKLPRLSRQDLESKEPQSLDTLVWLWDTIVSPVLTELGLMQAVAGSDSQHVWWIPIGPLVRFPLHAAGDHLSCQADTALDRVVSSYSSSIRAIIHGRQQPLQKLTADRKIALVAMEDTPGVGCLSFASKETDKVRDACKSMQIESVQSGLCKKEVLSALETCWMFHFAGHGNTHPSNPLQSQLLLEDWEEDPLTVASLLEINLSSGSPFLAYLSACGTGQIRNKQLINEGIHLTAAYQLAGFRHVIGTLWSVNDRLCVDMARKTYEAMRNNGISDASVSRALHHAMLELRDEWRSQIEEESDANKQISRDERDAVLGDKEGEKISALWVPYVHFGI